MEKKTYTDHNGNKFLADAMLPCPCCGGESSLLFKGNSHTKSRSVTIKCKSCRLQRTDAAIRNSAEWCAKTALELWNTRYES